MITFLKKVKQKLIYISCDKMGLKLVGGHLINIGSVNDSSVVVDLGGNLGIFSKEIVRLFNSNCYCVEPQSALFAKIPEHEKIQKINMAVADHDGEVTFTISDNPEASSMNNTIASKWGNQEIIKVPAISYRSLLKLFNINKIDVMKIDIEGAEIEWIRSMTDSELINITQITVEFHEYFDPTLTSVSNETVRRLEKLGFRAIVFSIDNYMDVLFLNSRFIRFNPYRFFWYSVHSLLKHKPSA